MKIPVIGEPDVGIRQTPTPYSNLNFDNGGRELAQGLDRLSQGAATVATAMNEAAKKAKEKTDATQAFGVWTALNEWEQSKVYDPRDGYLAQDGTKALAGADGRPLDEVLLEDFDKTAKQRIEGLANDDQKQAATKIYQQKRETVARTLESHWGRQNDVVQKNTFDAALDSSVSSAANGFANKDAIEQARALGQAAILVRGSQQGWTGDVTDSVRKDYLTKLHLAVADRMVDAGQLDQAQKYLEANGPEIDGKARGASNIDKVIQTKTEKKQGEATALGVISGSLDKNDFLVDDKADKDFMALPPEKRTGAAWEAFDRLKSLKNDEKAKAQRGIYDQAFSAFLTDHRTSDIDEGQWAWLKDNYPEGRHSLEQMEASWRASKEHGDKLTMGQATQISSFRVWVKDHPDEASKMTPQDLQVKWLPGMAPKDWETAGSILAEAHGKTTTNGKLDSIGTEALLGEGRAANVFPDKGTDVSRWSPHQQAVFYKAMDELKGWMASETKLRGKPPDYSEVKDEAAKKFQGGTVPGSGVFFDDKTTRIESTMSGKKFNPAWSSDQKDEARKALTAAGFKNIDDAALDNWLSRRQHLPASRISAPALPAPKPAAAKPVVNSGAGPSPIYPKD